MKAKFNVSVLHNGAVYEIRWYCNRLLIAEVVDSGVAIESAIKAAAAKLTPEEQAKFKNGELLLELDDKSPGFHHVAVLFPSNYVDFRKMGKQRVLVFRPSGGCSLRDDRLFVTETRKCWLAPANELRKLPVDNARGLFSA